MLLQRAGDSAWRYPYCNIKRALHWQLETSRVVAFQGDANAVLKIRYRESHRVSITYKEHRYTTLLLLHLENGKHVFVIPIWAVRACTCWDDTNLIFTDKSCLCIQQHNTVQWKSREIKLTSKCVHLSFLTRGRFPRQQYLYYILTKLFLLSTIIFKGMSQVANTRWIDFSYMDKWFAQSRGSLAECHDVLARSYLLHTLSQPETGQKHHSG